MWYGGAMLLLLSFMAQAQLVMGVSTIQTMPLVAFEAQAQGGQLIHGIVYEVYRQLQQRLDIELTVKPLPRKRLARAVLNGQIDGYCYVTPSWLTLTNEQAERVVFSAPLLESRDHLVSLPMRSAPIAELQALHAQRVGTLLGYHYPKLEPLFQQHKAIRVDAHSLEANLRRLHFGRVDFLVMDAISLQYVQRQQQRPLITHPLELSRYAPACAIHINSPYKAALLDALSVMRQEQVIEAIVRQYTLNPSG